MELHQFFLFFTIVLIAAWVLSETEGRSAAVPRPQGNCLLDYLIFV